jgi:hypothetical protein
MLAQLVRKLRTKEEAPLHNALTFELGLLVELPIPKSEKDGQARPIARQMSAYSRTRPSESTAISALKSS